MNYKMVEKDNSSLLHRQMEDLLGKSDDWWYSGMLDRSLCGRALSRREQDGVMHGSMDAAVRASRVVAGRFENQTPGSIAESLGLHVGSVKKSDLFGNEQILGLYDPKTSSVVLCEENIFSIRRFISTQNLSDILGDYDILNLALLHEIFHALEDRSPGIYTRSRMLHRKMLFFFPVKVGLDTASEIGAVHFSKLMSRLPFSPCIYELLLLVRSGRMIPEVWNA